MAKSDLFFLFIIVYLHEYPKNKYCSFSAVCGLIIVESSKKSATYGNF